MLTIEPRMVNKYVHPLVETQMTCMDYYEHKPLYTLYIQEIYR